MGSRVLIRAAAQASPLAPIQWRGRAVEQQRSARSPGRPRDPHPRVFPLCGTTPRVGVVLQKQPRRHAVVAKHALKSSVADQPCSAISTAGPCSSTQSDAIDLVVVPSVALIARLGAWYLISPSRVTGQEQNKAQSDYPAPGG